MSAAVAGGAVACGGGAGGNSDADVENRTAAAVGVWGCRPCDHSNSPHLSSHSLREFSVVPNPAEVALVAIEDPGGTRHPVKFDMGQLTATTTQGLLTGSDLVGWLLIFEASGVEDPVGIFDFQQHPDWVDGKLIDTWALAHFSGLGPQEGTPMNVCPGYAFEGDTSVVLTPGERWDFASRTVIPNQPDHVTVACRDDALMKLKFTGYAPDDGYGSNPQQRQATLKMLTADYCGDGVGVYTKVGQSLEWVDAIGNFPAGWKAALGLSSGLGAVEAEWNMGGATCLNEPRMVERKQVKCADKLPPCGEAPPPGPAAVPDWTSFIVH